jgi:YebC/PmpR family DNA-binding regulatory protein
MSGHSKWSTIKRKKGANDAARGKVFTQLARAITICAKEGGGDPDTNFSLRLAIDKARSANMPKDNIERAIKRGTGEGKEGIILEKIVYEGYAPHGVALVIDVVTDNKNRSVGDIRHILSRSGGNLGENGSVSWQFSKKAYFEFSSKGHDEDKIFEIAVDGGADDVNFEGDSVEIFGAADMFKEISDVLNGAGIQMQEAALKRFPNQEMELSVEHTLSVMKVIESLEELDDIQGVDSNLGISEEALAKLETE